MSLRGPLLSTVWGTDFEGAPNIVDVYIGYLRAKIDQLTALACRSRPCAASATDDPRSPRSGERP